MPGSHKIQPFARLRGAMVNKKGITLKIFAGIEIDPGLDFALKKSKSWKEESMWGEDALQEVHFEKKRYIGLYFAQESALLEEVEQVEKAVEKAVEKYCPKEAATKRAVQLFPQLFVS